MKNTIECINCKEENPLYRLTCLKCNSFLRSRIYNINLFQTIAELFESPVSTFKNIIYSDHKNFIIWLTILMSIKFALISFQVKNIFTEGKYSITVLFTSSFSSLLIFAAFLILIALLITILNYVLGLKTRFKDNYSIYIYSFVPQIISLIILFPVEIALYREYWFTFNPSPFVIKPTVTYFLFAIEGIMIAWSLLLLIFATYAQSRNKLYSTLVGLIIGLAYFLTIILTL
ncbi:YIP1 family protein [Melioribacteraceae bacterium 4301-Me]|uniref:YIP1 family protein n=1 Tax=Pyranulibacter aquaticus TaxID=3163344 RepID=UPI00359AA3C2